MNRINLFLFSFFLSIVGYAQSFINDKLTYTINEDQKTVTVYATDKKNISGTITIPKAVTNEGKTYIVTNIGYNAFEKCTNLLDITIPNTVTEIGESAFSGCSNILDLTIPNSVTTICSLAFKDCSGLLELEIPNSVTFIGYQAFYNCSKLTSIKGLDSKAITFAGNEAFTSTPWYNKQPDGLIYIGKCAHKYKGTTTETDITLREGTTSIAEFAFADTQITSIKMPNTIKKIWHHTFYRCSKLTSVTLSDSIVYIGDYAFAMADITSITIPTQVTSIESNAFYKCLSLANIHVSNSVNYVGTDAFTYTSWLNSQPNGLIYVGKVAYKYKGTSPNEITIKNGTTGVAAYAFAFQKELTNINIPNSVTYLGDGAFAQTALRKVKLPSSINSIKKNAFSHCTMLADINIPNAITSIEDGTFRGCISLEDIQIPNNVTKIGDNAFAGCTGISNLNIPISVTSFGQGAFNDCTGLTLNMKEVTSYFSSLTALRNVTLTNTVTSIGDEAFKGCLSLKNINIPSSITYIGKYAFYGCRLSNIIIPNSITSINNGTFCYCKSLVSVIIPNSVTSIEDHAFQGCSGLTSITIPNSVTSIGQSTFWGCIGLTSITIPNSITKIGDYAFDGCTGITSLYIPSSVNIIGGQAFGNFTGLSKLYIDRTTPPTSWSSSCWTNVTGCTLYVPGNSITKEKYQNWGSFFCKVYNFHSVTIGTSKNASIYLPFIAQVPNKLAAFAATTQNNSYIGLQEITDKVLNKNNGFILQGDEGLYLLDEIEIQPSITESILKGVTEDTTPSNNTLYYVLGQENNIIGMYRFNGEKLKANKAYLPIINSNSSSFFSFRFGDLTTNIKNATTDSNKTYYDLQGKRISRLHKGIIITNGKKVIF